MVNERLANIRKRHRLYDECSIPNSEYTASWDDVALLLSLLDSQQSAPVAECGQTEAWRTWFERMGERATADVVNATATLVIAERAITAAPVSETKNYVKCPHCGEEICFWLLNNVWIAVRA